MKNIHDVIVGYVFRITLLQ